MSLPNHEQEVSSDVEGQGNHWCKNALGAYVPAGGKYTEQESQIIKAAVEEYCSTKQVSISNLFSEYDHRGYLRGAWVEIAKNVPSRSIQSVYRHGIRLMHPFKRGTWTDEEVNILLESVVTLGKKWSVIQKKLNRTADSCRDKYREISGEYVKGEWKEAETEQLIQLIREHLTVESNTSIESLVKLVQERDITLPWTDFSNIIGSRSRLSCLKRWRTITLQFETSPSPSAPVDTLNKRPRKAASAASKRNAQAIDKDDDSSLEMELEREFPSKKKSRTRISPQGSSATNKISDPSSEPQDDISSKDDGNDSWFFDQDLLSTLASSSYTHVEAVPWASILHPLGNALDRWNSLQEDFLSQIQDTESEDEIMDLPIRDLARLMFQKRAEKNNIVQDHEEEEDAKIAARTVEALDFILNAKV